LTPLVLVGAFLSLWGTAACTQVVLKGSDHTEITNHLGVLSLKVDAQNKPLYVQTTGVGAILGQNNFNIGYLEQVMVVFPDGDDCRVVFVVEKARDAERLLSFFRESKIDLTNICVTGDGI